MDKYDIAPYVLMIVMLCACSAMAFEFHSQRAAQEEGYADGYNEHNESMFNYTSQYIEVYKPGSVEYNYNYGYCRGYKTRNVNDMKPE